MLLRRESDGMRSLLSSTQMRPDIKRGLRKVMVATTPDAIEEVRGILLLLWCSVVKATTVRYEMSSVYLLLSIPTGDLTSHDLSPRQPPRTSSESLQISFLEVSGCSSSVCMSHPTCTEISNI